jgi:hypothetical protein
MTTLFATRSMTQRPYPLLARRGHQRRRFALRRKCILRFRPWLSRSIRPGDAVPPLASLLDESTAVGLERAGRDRVLRIHWSIMTKGCYEVPWVCAVLGRDGLFWRVCAG